MSCLALWGPQDAAALPCVHLQHGLGSAGKGRLKGLGLTLSAPFHRVSPTLGLPRPSSGPQGGPHRPFSFYRESEKTWTEAPSTPICFC